MQNLAATLTRTGQTAAKRAQGRESSRAYRQLAPLRGADVVWLEPIRTQGGTA
ncbi:hypothetical protein C8N44_10581 [Allosediminivita pacifica]|uniref:Uncharacterized protein n=1 Tax=Allosediminivita pacifica TaxID=1267769 RepID=A0A2T6B2D7_9RHOB|nr:hypothetical protein [Allosediminivita pacifica]PTX50221.1 hypothetical protein C8N44_10581 [Allosediminivita pacifica]